MKYKVLKKIYLTFNTVNNTEMLWIYPGEVIEVKGNSVYWNGRESNEWLWVVERYLEQKDIEMLDN